MKSYPIIMQPESLAGIKKQWDYQQLTEFGASFGGSFIDAFSIGCKTETRRLTGLKSINENQDNWFGGTELDPLDIGKGLYASFFSKLVEDHVEYIRSPYGQPGDEIWVRETFCAVEMGIEKSEIAYAHKAERQGINPAFLHWKSPRFMPKQAARFILLNEGVSVERLQDISNESAICEGVIPLEDGLATLQYKDRWIEMHGQKSWDLNGSVLCEVVNFGNEYFRIR